jgi:hypothetical protein
MPDSPSLACRPSVTGEFTQPAGTQVTVVPGAVRSIWIPLTVAVEL